MNKTHHNTHNKKYNTKIQSYNESQDNQSSSEQRQYQFESDGQSQSNSSQNQKNIQIKKKQLLQMEERQIKQQLKNIPFGQLMRYRKLKQEVNNNGKTKQIKKDRSKKVVLDKNMKYQKGAAKQIKIMKRPLKNKYKQIFKSQKAKSIDPRFEQYAGHYNSGFATKSYSFIQDIQNNEVDYLKKQIKNKKIKQQQREVLLKNYNKITNDMKRFENQQLQRQVKAEYKNKSFNPKRRQFKQQVQRKKISNMDSKDQDRKIRDKGKKIQKQRMIQKKQFMSRNMNNNIRK